MNKCDLLNFLQERNQQWEKFLQQIDPARLDEPGVNGDWSMKDVIAHLAGWNRWLVIRLQAAQRGDAAPQPPWPGDLTGDEAVNGWIYAANKERAASEVLADMRQTHADLLATIAALPDKVAVECVDPAYYLVWLGDKRFLVGEFFDHFDDDHAPDVRAWLVRSGQA